MRRGVIGSATLHVAVIGAAMIAWPHSLDVYDEPPPVVPVELITIGDKTNIAPTVQEQPQPPPQPQPEQQAALEQPQPTPPEEAAETAPSELQPGAAEKPLPNATPTPRMKPQPEQQKFNVDTVLALLNKVAPKSAPPPQNAKLASRTMRGIGDRNAMTMDLEDALRSQIGPCWSPPLGAPRANELIVDFDLLLNPDGSVSRPPQLNANSMAAAANDPYTRAAAEAARRAIYKCAPYKLPAERYDEWREINPFHFDPRQMMGQE
jgi:hypothetical protein